MGFVQVSKLLISLLLGLLASTSFAFSEFSGMMARGGSSGVLIRIGSTPGQIYVLTAGHATEFSSFQLVGNAISKNVPNITMGSFPLFRLETVPVVDDFGETHDLEVSEVTYATLNGVDIGLFRVVLDNLQAVALSMKVYSLAAAAPSNGTDVNIISGKWRKLQSCKIDYLFSTLKESIFTWKNGYALSNECQVKGGWSGSPVINKYNDTIVAVVTTVNEGGSPCSFGNPCEVGADGSVLSHFGKGYAQQTQILTSCFDDSGELKLERSDCKLTKPNFLPAPNWAK